MTATQPLVQFRNVGKTYDGITNVLSKLELTIHRGEFLTLLGPSGSGKTTILMMLAGFETPTEGDIVLGGTRLNDIPAHKRNMGVVFQSYALFPHMSVAQNIAYPLRQRRIAKAEIAKKTDAALAMVNLSDLGGRMPMQLSGGQQQRVAVARALVFEPDLVLMDEPLGALDKNLREQMQLELKRLHSQLGMTVVYVTHDQTEALTMSDRIAIFDQGKILQLGAPADIYEKPMSAFVANFIGENNNLPGVISQARNGTCQVKLANEQSVEATNPLSLSAGASTNVVVRPEHIFLEASADGRPNKLTGRLKDKIYHGDHQRLELSVAGIGTITVKSTRAERISHLSIGDNVAICWQPDHCRALDPDESCRDAS